MENGFAFADNNDVDELLLMLCTTKAQNLSHRMKVNEFVELTNSWLYVPITV